MSETALAKIRIEIDAIDAQIQTLIGARAELAADVASIKKANHECTIFYRPEREAQVLRTVAERNTSLIKDADMAHIFREIMSACLALEQPLKIAYLGPQGTFTQAAAFKHFGRCVTTMDCVTIDEIFNQVEKGNAQYGVVPIENSSNGVIGATIDRLYAQDLRICGEVEISIQHQLMMADTRQPIQTIVAHQQALEQCQRWLAKHQPSAELISVASNALAAKMVKDRPNAAAIASNVALDLYDLHLVAKNIEDCSDNVTRFLILGKESVAPSGQDKTSLLAITKHQSGALFDLLTPFKAQNINLLQIARHPIPNVKWEYLFLLDIEGHQQDLVVKRALESMQTSALKLKILGSYPVAVL